MTGQKHLYNLAAPLMVLSVGALWLLPATGVYNVQFRLGMTERGGEAMSKFWGETRRDVSFDTATVDRGSIRKVVATSGPVRALVTVSIGSQISGQIDKIHTDFNGEVKAGDVLAIIDARTFESRVAQAKADLLSAEASLLNHDAMLRRSRAISKQAQRHIERQEALQHKGIAAIATVDTASRDVDVAAAEQDAAHAQIAIAKAVIVQKQATLRQAEVDLERTRIIAPVDGTVISRTVDVGQTVAASLQAPELFKIAQDLRRIRIEAQVNEADVGQVAAGNLVTFKVDAYPGRTFEGTVTKVRLAATEIQNVVTYTAIIEASNDDRKLLPGMTATAEIEVSKKDGVLRIPNDALRFRPRIDPSLNPADRISRWISQLKTDVQLTADQEQAVRSSTQTAALIQPITAGLNTSEAIEAPALRQRFHVAVEQAVGPKLTGAQKQLFDQWKLERENPSFGHVHLVDSRGRLERRPVKLGMSDDLSTEIDGLSENERVVVRARKAVK